MKTNSSKNIPLIVILIVLILSAVLSMFVGLALLVPGSFLDSLWVMNPAAKNLFLKGGYYVGVTLLLMSVVCGITVFGLLRKCKWGWYLSTILFTVVFIFNVLRLFSGDPGEFFGTPFTLIIMVLHFLPQVRRIRNTSDNSSNF